MVCRIILLCYGLCWIVRAMNDPYPDRIVSSDGHTVVWTSKWPIDARVEFFGSKSLSLVLKFSVNDINSSLQLGKWKHLEIYFRYRNPFLFKRKKMKGKTISKSIMINNVSVLLQSDPSYGANATFDNVPPEKELPIMFCVFRLETTRGSVTSNRLHILDFRKNYPKKVWHPQMKPTLHKNDISSLKCLRQPLGIDQKLSRSKSLWRQPTVGVSFKWYLCSGNTLINCNASRKLLTDLEDFPKWPMQVQRDGQLFLPFIPDRIVGIFRNKSLICELDGGIVAFYANGFNIVGSMEKTISPLTMVRPIGEEAVILYDSSRYELQLPCLFNTTTTINVTWTYNKTKVLPAGMEDVVLKVRVSAVGRSITFSGRFHESTEGSYTCHVTSGGHTKSGSYRVSFKGPPRPSDRLPSVALIAGSGDTEVSCNYQQPQRISTLLAVLGNTINLESKKDVNDTMSRINRRYEPIPPLNFSVNMISPKTGDVIRLNEYYNQSNLKRMSSSHYITCIGMQPPFNNRKVITVKYMKPVMKMKTVTRLCAFSCTLKNRAAFEEAGATMRVAWTAGGSTIGGNTTVLNLCSNPLNLRFWKKAIRCDIHLSESISGRSLFDLSNHFEYKDERLVLILSCAIVSGLCLFVINLIIVFILVRKRKTRFREKQPPNEPSVEDKSPLTSS